LNQHERNHEKEFYRDWACLSGASAVTDPQILCDLARVRQIIAKYHDFNAALADRFILPPGTECVEDSQTGGMDPTVNILEPEILL